MTDFKPRNLTPTSIPASNQLYVGDHLEETNFSNIQSKNVCSSKYWDISTARYADVGMMHLLSNNYFRYIRVGEDQIRAICRFPQQLAKFA